MRRFFGIDIDLVSIVRLIEVELKSWRTNLFIFNEIWTAKIVTRKLCLLSLAILTCCLNEHVAFGSVKNVKCSATLSAIRSEVPSFNSLSEQHTKLAINEFVFLGKRLGSHYRSAQPSVLPDFQLSALNMENVEGSDIEKKDLANHIMGIDREGLLMPEENNERVAVGFRLIGKDKIAEFLQSLDQKKMELWYDIRRRVVLSDLNKYDREEYTGSDTFESFLPRAMELTENKSKLSWIYVFSETQLRQDVVRRLFDKDGAEPEEIVDSTITHQFILDNQNFFDRVIHKLKLKIQYDLTREQIREIYKQVWVGIDLYINYEGLEPILSVLVRSSYKRPDYSTSDRSRSSERPKNEAMDFGGLRPISVK